MLRLRQEVDIHHHQQVEAVPIQHAASAPEVVCAQVVMEQEESGETQVTTRAAIRRAGSIARLVVAINDALTVTVQAGNNHTKPV